MKDIEGYIQLNRNILNWQWYDKTIVKDVFFHLLLTSQFTDFEWQGVQLEQGQTIISYKGLSKALGISIQEARTAINKLVKSEEITIKPTNKFTIVTIEKWEDYIFKSKKQTSKTTFNQHSTNNQSTFNQHQYNNKKKYKNKNNDDINTQKPSYNIEEFEARAIPLPVYVPGATSKF